MSGYGAAILAHGATATLVVLIVFVPLFLMGTLLARSGFRVPLRPIRAYRRLVELSDEAPETGAPIPVVVGGGAPEGATLEALAGLATFEHLARQAARTDVPAPAATDNPATLLMAAHTLRESRERHGFHESYRAGEVRFQGPTRLGLGLGTGLDLARGPRTGTALAGDTGEGALWLGQRDSDPGAGSPPVLGVSNDPGTMALIALAPGEASTAGDDALPGEDLYAAGAYLHRPVHEGSLRAEDWARALLVSAIVVAVLLTSLGYGG